MPHGRALRGQSPARALVRKETAAEFSSRGLCLMMAMNRRRCVHPLSSAFGCQPLGC